MASMGRIDRSAAEACAKLPTPGLQTHDARRATPGGGAKFRPMERCDRKPELQLALVLLAKREIFDEFKNGVLTGRPTPTYIRNTGGDVA